MKVLNVFVDVLFFDASLSLESDTLSRQLIVFATKDLFDYLPFDFMLLATSDLWYVFGNNVLAIFSGDESQSYPWPWISCIVPHLILRVEESRMSCMVGAHELMRARFDWLSAICEN